MSSWEHQINFRWKHMITSALVETDPKSVFARPSEHHLKHSLKRALLHCHLLVAMVSSTSSCSSSYSSPFSSFKFSSVPVMAMREKILENCFTHCQRYWLWYWYVLSLSLGLTFTTAFECRRLWNFMIVLVLLGPAWFPRNQRKNGIFGYFEDWGKYDA